MAGDNPATLTLPTVMTKRVESCAAWVKEAIAAREWELIRTSPQRGQYYFEADRDLESVVKKIIGDI
jgi:hypothetical protein